MNILLISQCSGNAIKETRRILDQFAERRGDRTWQTPITKDGLDTLHRLLRKTARKNTAVACHWIRGIDHSELLWIVGDKRQFNPQGAVPTNKTSRNVLRRSDENNWHTHQDIYLLSGLAALLHDLGKASEAFQSRLQSTHLETNLYRHEWVSLRLFQAFVGKDLDETWLNRLASPCKEDDSLWLERLQKDGISAFNPYPFKEMSPLARAVGWLILTHHRLPGMPGRFDNNAFSTEILEDLPDCITAGWNEQVGESTIHETESYWKFLNGLPVTTEVWKKKASRIAKKLLNRPQPVNDDGWLSNPYVMHLSRLSLMLGDHAYSSLPSDPRNGTPNYPLFANTDRDTHSLKQRLDEHLIGVEGLTGQVVHALPQIVEQLPSIARHRGLRQRSADAKYHWQDKAVELAESIRLRSIQQGVFIVNMASTGSGKTLANARVMYALAEPSKGMRCAFALGLRTLTLQTGREYRVRLSLSEDEAAIRIGGTASIELSRYLNEESEMSGSESMRPLLDEDSHVFYDSAGDTPPVFDRILKDPKTRSLIAAPMLICTIDQLIPATESTRGGHQIAPMLRLLSGDLVLDELDDYDIDDMSAVARLMNWAGLLGCRVLISSATLPPALVQGMFDSYREGRLQFQRDRGERPNEAADICAIWIDEFGCTNSDCKDLSSFTTTHKTFVERRTRKLATTEIRRLGEIAPLPNLGDSKEKIRDLFAEQIINKAVYLHDLHHDKDPKSGKRVSFGLVRMANIGPLFEVALNLFKRNAPKNYRIHLCVYHSQFPLLIRSMIENRLDSALDRHDPQQVFALPDIRHELDSYEECDHLFIVLGSPVTEVGRDHDYDWALVEPSSMRSLIQVAGRVRRHRSGTCTSPNVLVFDRNLKAMEQPGQPAYCRPGFENTEFRLESHSLETLLTKNELSVIDARPRIQMRSTDDLRPANSLVDLEHVRVGLAMLRPKRRELSEYEIRHGVSNSLALGAYTWWAQPKSTLSGILQFEQQFRKQTEPQIDLALLPDENTDEFHLAYRIDLKRGHSEYVRVEKSKNRRMTNEISSHNISPWGDNNYSTSLQALSENLDIDEMTCAKRFGTFTLPDAIYGWQSHPTLGFSKYHG